MMDMYGPELETCCFLTRVRGWDIYASYAIVGCRWHEVDLDEVSGLGRWELWGYHT
jgi:hypothetical protein